jgi:hypothetical protein
MFRRSVFVARQRKADINAKAGAHQEWGAKATAGLKNFKEDIISHVEALLDGF